MRHLLLLAVIGTFAVLPISAQSFLADATRSLNNLFAPKVSGSGNVVEETRQFSAFHTVRVDAPFSVEVDCRSEGSPSVYVRADDNILPMISTTLKNGVLTISLDNEVSARGFDSPHIKVVVQAPASDRVELLGAGSIHVEKVNRAELTLGLFGVGSITATGTVGKFTLDANGVGSVDAKRLKAEHVSVSSHGIGSTSVYASARLDADIGGIGSLTYYGNPSNVRKSAGGIGSIRKGSARFEP